MDVLTDNIYLFLQNLVNTVDNLYSPQNEIAYSTVDSKEEVLQLLVIIYCAYVSNYMYIMPVQKYSLYLLVRRDTMITVVVNL